VPKYPERSATVDATKIRNILNASLFYKESEFQSGFLETQEKIVRFARTYIERLKQQDVSRLKLADILGITDISLSTATGLVLDYKKEMQMIHGSNAEQYTNATSVILESRSIDNLARIINIINRIPEIKMDILGRGSFEPEQVAKIVIGWVNGKPLKDIAKDVQYENESFYDSFSKCQKYINSNIASYVPWGVSIYQHLTGDDKSEEAKNLPSYVYYGVNDKESVVLSKIGIPRFLIAPVKKLHKKQYENISITIDNIEEIKGLLNNYQASDFSDIYKDGEVIASILKDMTK
jgi:hypothetical protein